MRTEDQLKNQFKDEVKDNLEFKKKRAEIEELQIREYNAVFFWLAGLIALVIFFKVPVGVAPKGAFLNVVKAPWIFGGIQELLLYTPAWFAGILFPIFSTFLLLSVPWWEKRIKLRWVHLGVFTLLGFWVLLTGLYVLK